MAKTKLKDPTRPGRPKRPVAATKGELKKLCKKNKREDGRVVISAIARELRVTWSKTKEVLLEKNLVDKGGKLL